MGPLVVRMILPPDLGPYKKLVYLTLEGPQGLETSIYSVT